MDTMERLRSSHAEAFAGFVASLSAANVPARALKQAQACLLNSIGCGFSGAQLPWGQLIAANTAAEAAPGVCTVLTGDAPLTPPGAALVNGTAIHGYELDDLIPGTYIHPGTVVVPAALAAAEHAGVSGLRLLLGVVAGYEAMMRVSLSLGSEPAQRGFHMTSVVGPVGAAIAAAVTMGLPAETVLSAIGLACSSASGVKAFATGGGMVKRMHAGQSASAGIRMAQLAARGFTGPLNGLEGKFGLLEVFGGKTANAAKLGDGLGEDWAMDHVWVKVYPICAIIHTTVQVLERIRGEKPLQAEEIAALRVGTTQYGVRYNADPAPTDAMGAQYSLPFCAATAALASVTDPEAFSDAAIANPVTRALAARVELVEDPEATAAHPAKNAARVELRLTNGEVRTGMIFETKGTPADPCSEAELDAIFRRLAGAAKSPAAMERILEAASRLESAPDVRALSDALRS